MRRAGSWAGAIRVVVTSRPQGDCGGMSVAILELGTEGCLRRRLHAITVTVSQIVTAPAAAAAVPTRQSEARRARDEPSPRILANDQNP